jgi:hypothetical protein
MKKASLVTGLTFFVFVMATLLSGIIWADPDGEVVINGGDLFTNSRVVNLTFDTSLIQGFGSPTEMTIATQPGTLGEGGWIPYSSSMEYNLPTGVDGVYTVYVIFREGRQTSEPFQDSITLDTTPPSLLITNPAGNEPQISSSMLQTSWTAEDAGSGVDYIAVVDSNGNFVNVGNAMTYELTGLSNGNYVFSVIAFDNAGNSRTASVNFLVNISATPSPSPTTPVNPSPSPTEPTPNGTTALYILTIAVGVIAVPTIGYAVYSLKKPFTQAHKVSEKLNKKLEEKNYKQGLKELDKLIKLINKLVSSTKLPAAINKPPYNLSENLTSIKKTLSEKFQENTIDNLLRESEIRPYLLGIICVLNTFKNLKDFKPLKRAHSSSKFFVPFISQTTKVFDKVNQINKQDAKDFWFIWKNDEYEPIRIFFDNEKTVGARFRWHWKHIDTSDPYVDDKDRIEVLFLPKFHTPIIRRSKEDICFQVFAKCYCAIVHDYKLVFNEEIKSYYTKAEEKPEHWPTVYYEGW